MFENGAPRVTYGPTREELKGYRKKYIIRSFKVLPHTNSDDRNQEMGGMWHKRGRGAYILLVGKPDKKGPLGSLIRS